MVSIFAFHVPAARIVTIYSELSLQALQQLTRHKLMVENHKQPVVVYDLMKRTFNLCRIVPESECLHWI